jgi:hypothetical protein
MAGSAKGLGTAWKGAGAVIAKVVPVLKSVITAAGGYAVIAAGVVALGIACYKAAKAHDKALEAWSQEAGEIKKASNENHSAMNKISKDTGQISDIM